MDVLATLLEDEGHIALRAHDGAGALAIAERERPDHILSEVMMPHLGGLELAARLLAWGDSPIPPVILLSAVPPPPLPSPIVFIRKPFDLDTLLAAVDRLLDPACAAWPPVRSPFGRQRRDLTPYRTAARLRPDSASATRA